MKIALVTPYWFPVRGGITTYVQELANELRRTYAFDVPVIAREGRAEADVTVLGGTAMQFVRRAAAQLERLQPETIHAHGHWYALAAGLRYRRRHPETRVVFTLHTPFPFRARRLGLRLVLSRADFVTGVSADLLGVTMRTIGIRTRTRVTPPGVSLRPANVLSTDEFLRTTGLENRRPLIGYVGRLVWEQKVRGVTQLIRAMKTVRVSFPSATLVVAGDGPHLRPLKEFAEAEVPGGVVFVGDVQDPLTRFYSAIDLYAHISFQEGMPLALLEAMACGKAIVASNVGGIPEVVRNGQNGFLVSGSSLELAARIVEVLTSPDLMVRLGTNAMAEVAARFTWTRTARRFLSLYGIQSSRRRIAITVDLERDPYSTELSFRGAKEAMPKLLELFKKHQVRATVFTTSDVCDLFPEVVEAIVRHQHALGCHGESHNVEYISRQTYEWQLESVSRATDTLERRTGLRPYGFRAPNFSANGDTIRVLEELGYEYDSSVLPGRRVMAKRLLKLLDFREAPRDPYQPSRDDPAIPGTSNLWELPVAENPFAPGGPIGLGYLNAYGVEKTIQAIALSSSDPCVFLIHPWELVDPPPGPIPEWMRAACTSDPSKLDALLERLGQEHDLTTIDAELAMVR